MDREIDWISRRAWNDGQFLLEQFFSRAAQAVREANRLPESILRNRRFKLTRGAVDPSSAFVVEMVPGPRARVVLPDRAGPTILFSAQGRGVEIRRDVGFWNIRANVEDDGIPPTIVQQGPQGAVGIGSIDDVLRSALEPFFFDH